MSDFDSAGSTPIPLLDRPSKRRRYDDSETSTPRYSSPDELAEDHKPMQSSNLKRSPRRRSDSPEEGSRSPPYRRSRSLSSNEDTPRSSHGSPRDRSPPSYKPLRLNYKQKFILKGHRKGVSQVRFSPDGCWIASCSADGTIKIWDSVTGKHMRTLEGHLAGVSTLAWSPDSNTLATGGDDKAIRLWDRASGKPYPVPLLGHHNYVFSVAFSPKGNMLASGSYDEALFLWDLRARRQMRSLPAHSDPIGTVDFIRDGTLIASCSTDGLIRIWDTATGQCLRTLVHEDNPPVTTVRFSPNGRYILAFTLDSSIRLWDYVNGTCKKTYQGHTNLKYSLGGSFGVGGTDGFVVSGSEDGDIYFWDVRTKDVVQKASGHEGVVCWVDSCPTTGTVASGGLDGTVRIWVDVPEEQDEVNGLDDLKIDNGNYDEHEDSDIDMHEVKQEGAKGDYDNDTLVDGRMANGIVSPAKSEGARSPTPDEKMAED